MIEKSLLVSIYDGGYEWSIGKIENNLYTSLYTRCRCTKDLLKVIMNFDYNNDINILFDYFKDYNYIIIVYNSCVETHERGE